MNYKTPALLLTVFLSGTLIAQQETYSVEKTSFSSQFYDEFAPVLYDNGLVFCTNRSSGLTDYSTSRNAKFIKIFYIDTISNGKALTPRLFSKYLRTRLNDGPVTFNSKGDTIYFSNNLITTGNLSKISASRNKLGIFYAVREDNKWVKIREMRFNNEWYNISTPYLSPQGERMYFASDKPDGFGGSDLYYSDRKGDYWSDPVNLGPVINTRGNEAYPFVNPAGELFFSSDGHPGMGGKDIFFSRKKNGAWLTPVRLDPPVNSQYDDFGFITDSLIAVGYFSSNRDNSLDIYRFKTRFPQIFYTDIQKENQYCFTFRDSGSIEIDTVNLRYAWDFGDGQKSYGAEVQHCFQGPGVYDVKLDLIDRATGKIYFSKLAYRLDLKDIEQPYINSPDVVIAGESVDLDGLKSFLPGYDIISYSWDFGDGSRMQGRSVKYTFKRSGEFNVNLGLKLKSLSTGIIHNTGVSKKIVVVSNADEKTAFMDKKASEIIILPDIRNYTNAYIKTAYSAEEEFKKAALFRIEIYSSNSRTSLNSSIFKNVLTKYEILEEANPESGIYHYYTTDEETSLMSVYPAYREITGLGFKDARVRLNIITGPVKKELHYLLKNYGFLSDTYFDNYNRLKANAYLMLDQVVILMNRNPGIRLEIEVYTDNQGSASNNLRLSQTRAQVMVNYLINRGINAKRLTANGYGGTKPVTPNITATDRQLNRRVKMRVIN